MRRAARVSRSRKGVEIDGNLPNPCPAIGPPLGIPREPQRWNDRLQSQSVGYAAIGERP